MRRYKSIDKSGKPKKFLTFSYDDGVTQDIRLIELFNKYGMKATFNLNSELLGLDGELVRDGVRITHIKNKKEDVKHIYEGHEVAAYTLTHPFLPADDERKRGYLLLYQSGSTVGKVEKFLGI